jgi:ABC-type Fe3+/spermidine/putrescine transport system ATPase subunit
LASGSLLSIRPDGIALVPQTEGVVTGTVTECIYRGATVDVGIALSDTLLIQARVSSRSRYAEPGVRIGLEFDSACLTLVSKDAYGSA